MNVLITTPMPVPYQVELLDRLAVHDKLNLSVLYTHLSHTSRNWERPVISHKYFLLNDLDATTARDLVLTPDLVVFSGYHPYQLQKLIALRAASNKPWAFWGERPGVLLPRWIGRRYRQIVIPGLSQEATVIWGIGSWAAEGYRAEYGEHKLILNIPYFSRLGSFLSIDRSDLSFYPRRILFSGSLIKRKGIDLLVRAFQILLLEFPLLELHILGDGPMRQELGAMTAQIGDRVYFHGFKQWAELPAAYANADILCAPSRHDGWGLIVQEGLAAGLLVVSTDQTGAALDLLASDCGWVVPAGQLVPLIDALRAALSVTAYEKAERIAKGREIAKSQDLAAGAERVVAAIEQSISHSRSVGGGTQQ